jgi:adenosine deaminase
VTGVSRDAVAAAPKCLLHDHLDGGLRPETILELADDVGWTRRLPSTDVDELQAWFTRGADSRDILQYLATFEHTLAVMQRSEALDRIAYEATADLAADGVVYAELRYAPEQHTMPLDASLEAVCNGIRRGERDAALHGRPIEVNVIICAMRTEQRSSELAEFVARVRHIEPKAVGFDLAGAETGWPPALHEEALALARREHLNITIHASEPPDLELISDALAHGAHRIGHGVRLDRDTRRGPDGELLLGPLAQFVLDHQIHLEMAPTCNTQIGAVASVADHPIGAFLRHGFHVSVNTDNRLMSHVSPSSELWAVASAFGLEWHEIGRLVENGIRASFAPYATRRRLIESVVRPAYEALAA